MSIGAAYVFITLDNGQTWSEQQKLVAYDRAPDDSFGNDVAVHSNVLVVAAGPDDNERGTDAGSR